VAAQELGKDVPVLKPLVDDNGAILSLLMELAFPDKKEMDADEFFTTLLPPLSNVLENVLVGQHGKDSDNKKDHAVATDDMTYLNLSALFQHGITLFHALRSGN
jgi:hypothetical protein